MIHKKKNPIVGAVDDKNVPNLSSITSPLPPSVSKNNSTEKEVDGPGVNNRCTGRRMDGPPNENLIIFNQIRL